MPAVQRRGKSELMSAFLCEECTRILFLCNEGKNESLGTRTLTDTHEKSKT